MKVRPGAPEDYPQGPGELGTCMGNDWTMRAFRAMRLLPPLVWGPCAVAMVRPGVS